MRKIWGLFAILLVLTMTFSSMGSSADSSTPTPSASSNCTGANGQSQLGQYCGSAQSAQEGSDANSSLSKVWGGVATICLSACFGGSVSPSACTPTNIAGTTTEGVMTKQYASSMTSIAASQSGQLSSLTGGKSATSAATTTTTTTTCTDPNDQSTCSSTISNPADAQKAAAKKKAKQNACTAGTAAAAKSINDFRDMQAQNQVAQQSNSNAKNLQSNTDGSVGPATATAAGIGANVGLAAGTPGASAATAVTLASTCASARQTSSAAETIQCAVANDSTLPSSVTSPAFLNAFQQASGTGFSNFGNAGQSPADAIAQAAAGSIGTADAVKVAAVLKNLEGDLMSGSMEAAPYTANGGGGAGAPEDTSATDSAKLMAGMMEQMQGKPNAQGKVMDGPESVVFANQNRSPASIPQDRTLSLFDRVSYRYFYELKKMEDTGGKR